MLNPLANWRENSEKFALGIQDDDDEEEKQLEMHRRGHGDASSVSDRRNSHSFAHSKSLSDPPMSSGLDSAHGHEVVTGGVERGMGTCPIIKFDPKQTRILRNVEPFAVVSNPSNAVDAPKMAEQRVRLMTNCRKEPSCRKRSVWHEELPGG